MQETIRNIKILRDCMTRKENILNNLIDMTREQEAYLSGDEFDVDVFDGMIDAKNLMLDELNSVDNGFENVYNRVRDELKDNSSSYADEIRDLKNCIREITSLSMQLQALEERNRSRLEKIFSSKQVEITGYKRASNQVSAYYQTMTGNSAALNSIVDKKK